MFGGQDRRKPVPEKAPSAKPPSPPPLDPSNDALTGLLGSESLNHEIAAGLEAASGGEHVAIGYIAFDGLHELIDKSGNLVGDTILRELGKRLRATVRETDHIGRIARDEFVIVFRALAGRLETLTLVSRLRNNLSDTVALAGTPYKPIVNIGLAHPPTDGTTAEATVGVAEKAMLATRDQMREAAKRDAALRLANARAAVETATKNVTIAEQNVRDADAALVDAKRLLIDAKAAVVTAADNAKLLGVTDPVPTR